MKLTSTFLEKRTMCTLSALALGAACLSTSACAQRHVPALDLAFAASDLVVFGRADVDSFGRPAIRVLERIFGTESSTLLLRPGGVRLGLHERPTRTPSLLFLQKQRIGAAVTWRVTQFSGTVIAVTPESAPRLRALVSAFALLRVEAVGSAHALLSFAEREAQRDPRLSRVALRSLARRNDIVMRESSSALATRFMNLLENFSLDAALRAEAACCLASLDERRTRRVLETLLVTGRAAGMGREIGPLFVQLTRARAEATMLGLLDRAQAGGHAEILHCLRSMQTVRSRRELARLAADPLLRDAMQLAAIR